MKKFRITYLSGQSVIAKAISLESAKAESYRMLKVMQRLHPQIGIASIVEVN